ncbi:hypothetical protein P378_06955 [Desulforamulus profundi]|uniref:Uncharacterized protein n=1 Tax=Desulforamulus profundi TaxID=1383067 RepID=A0A2C6MGK3_9FIRM|nr:hypothetical protein P378_06955 [Desulforamulus profundi]
MPVLFTLVAAESLCELLFGQVNNVVNGVLAKLAVQFLFITVTVDNTPGNCFIFKAKGIKVTLPQYPAGIS